MRNGVLSTRATGEAPQLIVDDVGVAVEEPACVAARVRASKEVSSCEMFWTTAAEPALSADKSFRFPLVPDGKWHEVQILRRPGG